MRFNQIAMAAALAGIALALPAAAWDHSPPPAPSYSYSYNNARTYYYPTYYSHGSSSYGFNFYHQGNTAGMTGFNGQVGYVSTPHRADWERRLRYDAEMRAQSGAYGSPECGFINSPEYCYRVDRLYPPTPPHSSVWMGGY